MYIFLPVPSRISRSVSLVGLKESTTSQSPGITKSRRDYRVKGGRSPLATRMALAQKYLINGNLCARKLCKVRPEFQPKAAAIKATPIAAATAGWYEEVPITTAVPNISAPRRF